MQTFLPYPSFKQSAAVLDNKRLGKQRVETLQILKTINNEYGVSQAWVNHPAVRMWRDNPLALVSYGIFICEEWIARGFKDTCLDKIGAYHSIFLDKNANANNPVWLGRFDLHQSHQSRLIFKNPAYYRPKFGPLVPSYLAYIWPV